MLAYQMRIVFQRVKMYQIKVREVKIYDSRTRTNGIR